MIISRKTQKFMPLPSQIYSIKKATITLRYVIYNSCQKAFINQKIHMLRHNSSIFIFKKRLRIPAFIGGFTFFNIHKN